MSQGDVEREGFQKEEEGFEPLVNISLLSISGATHLKPSVTLPLGLIS